VTRLLLAVARQVGIALVVLHPRFRPAPTAHARVHFLRVTALAVGHLMRVHVPGFTKPDPHTQSQHQCKETSWQLWETVPAMH